MKNPEPPEKKGFRHPVQNTVVRTNRILNTLLGIVAKCDQRDKFQVTPTSVPYLAALISVSEEVRTRCHLKHRSLLPPSQSTTSIADFVNVQAAFTGGHQQGQSV
ncbi:unnamed protein product, partial [Didymodactylos carnosus]